MNKLSMAHRQKRSADPGEEKISFLDNRGYK